MRHTAAKSRCDNRIKGRLFGARAAHDFFKARRNFDFGNACMDKGTDILKGNICDFTRLSYVLDFAFILNLPKRIEPQSLCQANAIHELCQPRMRLVAHIRTFKTDVLEI